VQWSPGLVDEAGRVVKEPDVRMVSDNTTNLFQSGRCPEIIIIENGDQVAACMLDCFRMKWSDWLRRLA